jgi:hypothetical protein
MQIDYKMPRPEDVAAIEYRARQMRAEAVTAMFAALSRAVRGLFDRSGKVSGGAARA